MNTTDQLQALADKLRVSIKKKRYEHTLGVVDCAVKLAKIYNENIEQAQLAAMLHDCGREIRIDDSVEYALRNGLSVDDIEHLQPILLHAKIGRLLAKCQYGIKDERVLDAIAYHSTGHEDMDNLAMIVYIADMLEAGRDFPQVEYLRNLMGTVSLTELMLVCLRWSLDYLLEQGMLIHLDSVQTYNSMLQRHNKQC